MSEFVISRRKRREIQNGLICCDLPGFPFDFAQGGEPVEPRVSLNPPIRYGIELARSKIPTSSAGNDNFVELLHRLRISVPTSAPQGIIG
jgi:hypothetical protein